MIFAVFLLGLYEQFMSHFFLWSIISTKKLPAEGKLWLKTLVGMSSRTYNIYPPPFLSRSNLNGAWKPSIKPSSSFDSDNIKVSICPLIYSQRKLNLFLKELIFRCPNINLLILLTRISLRVLIAFEIIVFEVLETLSISI